MRLIDRYPELRRFLKFASVGVLNTTTDFAILNALLYVFGAGPSGEYALWKGLAFSGAVLVSYALNSRWVFSDRKQTKNTHLRGAAFFTVSVIGFALNVAVSTLAYAHGMEMFPGNGPVVSNASALIGTATVLLFNFFGYKHFVFRKASA